MNDENRYEPYQYGKPQEPQFEEPDLDRVNNEDADTQESRYDEPQFAESEFQEEIRQEEQESNIPRYDYSYTGQSVPPQEPMNAKKGVSIGKVFATVALAILFGLLASVVFQVSNRVIDSIFGAKTNQNKITH